MSWTAWYQADGELRHTITVTKFKWTAEHELEEFLKRMTNPEAQVFWTGVEGSDEETGEENNEKHITEQKPNAEEIVDLIKVTTGPFAGILPFIGGGSPFSL